jgi:hypothetical protein
MSHPQQPPMETTMHQPSFSRHRGSAIAQSWALCSEQRFGFSPERRRMSWRAPWRAREIIGNGAEEHGTSAALDSGNPIGRKLKASHLADQSAAAVEPSGIAHRRFKASFVESMQPGRAIEALDLQALDFA